MELKKTLDSISQGLPIAVAPTNSQQITCRAFDVDSSRFFASAAIGESIFGDTAMLSPSLPSTACLSSADDERTNQDEEGSTEGVLLI